MPRVVAATASTAELSALRADELYAAYAAPLLRYCRRRLGGPEEAEDAVQTTFLYATRALQRGVVPECESAWLHTIAKNVCRWQRRTAARAACSASDPLSGPLADEPARETSPELAFDVREALARVPERQRQALLLREVRGLPASEVAATLGLGAGETYALLSRARRSFAKAYEVVTGRPALGVHVAPVLLKLKAALTGGAATVVAATTIAGGVAIGLGGASVRDSGPQTRLQVPAQLPAQAPDARTSALGPGDAPALGVSRGALWGAQRAWAPAARSAQSRPSGTAPVAAPAGGKAEAPTPSGSPDRAKPEGASPRNDAPSPAPVPVPAPSTPLPIDVPDLGVELPVDPPPLPEVDAGKILDDLVPPVLDEALPPLAPLPVVRAPEL